MGLRFQRRVAILPGVRLNLSKSGIGVSVGTRGAHVGITARGQRYASVGVPGTGVSWREYERKAKAAPRAEGGQSPTRPAAARCELCQPGHVHIHGGVMLLCLAGLVGWFLWALVVTH
jgi:hypothetical protein